MPALQAEPSTRIQVESDTAFLRVTDALAREQVSLSEDMRERIGQLEKLATVGLFTSNIAHEIKNALVGVKTCVQLAAGTELGPLANREVLRIESLVNLLSQYVSKNKQSFADVNLNQVVDNAARSLESARAGKNISLQIELQAAPATIKGSGMQLEQALLNLLLNAVEATPAGGAIGVRSYNESGQVRVELRDSGAGIPVDDLERIFEPFYSTKARGSGLGLGITRRIVREHKGNIEVASESGRGATFTLTFPVAEN
ncbi:MAG TPA: ATP-binding protein [Verrucomicrobiae bacterium]|nr:ATP-binding protein [Verrucomicrobiae bacterium]